MTQTATETRQSPAGAHTTQRPWDSPYAQDRGIPWSVRKYVFDWTVGRINVAPCGDGHASNGGWRITSNVNTTTGKESNIVAVADEDAYEAQNRLGFPLLTHRDAEKIFKTAEDGGICLRDALFEALNLDDLGLNEAQKLSCASAREVYVVPRPEAVSRSERAAEAKARLAKLTAKQKPKK
ncbi:MAG: hypothetical protein IT181_13630 [Acidobacteria bacterium]|nr:hypothetical protein [Acidobacteriota bacterium]